MKRTGKRFQRPKKGPEPEVSPVPVETVEPEEEDGNYGGFITELAALEGAPRFLHADNVDEDSGLTAGQALGASALSLEAMLQSVAPEKGREAQKVKTQSQEWKLSAPLSDPAALKVQRRAVYQRTQEEVAQWDPVVHSRRAAQSLSFPLKSTPETQATAKWQAQTPLEREVAAILHGSKSVVNPDTGLSEREESILTSLTLHEALEKREQLTHLRALQSYHETKMKRQNKIKSKRYRKTLRKRKDKEKMQEMAELQRNHPELALEKLEELERVRITERASLKHRNSSKYLKMQAKRAKYSKESQNNLQDQLNLHRSLVVKHAEAGPIEGDDIPSDESEDEEATKPQPAAPTPDIAVDTSVIVPLPPAPGPESPVKATKRKGKAAPQVVAELTAEAKEQLNLASNLDDLFHVADHLVHEKVKLGLRRGQASRKSHPIPEADSDEEATTVPTPKAKLEHRDKRTAGKKSGADSAVLDPNSFVTTTDLGLPVLNEANPVEENEDDDMATLSQQKADISEAFADDQVDIDFSSEKKRAVEANKPKTLDLTLPGWGSWGGEGLKVSKRKRKQFTVRAPPPPKRRDENQGHLILNDLKNEAFRAHQVNNVPFPFTSVSSFEASIRAPVGETFVPQRAFKKLIQPRVRTKAGHVIEPMQKDELVKRQKV